MDIKIGEVIRQKRIEFNFTQEELASLLGVTKAAVSKWELAQNMPDITLLPTIATLFRITTDELFGCNFKGQEKRLTTRFETGITSWEDLRDHNIFDHAKIKKVNIYRCGTENNLHYSVYALFESEEPDFLRLLQEAMNDGIRLDVVSKKLENGKEMQDEPIYHHWVCKHKIYTFRAGDTKTVKAITRELVELGIMKEDDLYC